VLTKQDVPSLGVGRSSLLAGCKWQGRVPWFCRKDALVQGLSRLRRGKRKEEDCVVDELEMEEPSCEGDLSTGLKVKNGEPGLLSLGTGEEVSCVVVEKVIGELGITGGVTEEPKGKNEGIYPKISNPVIQLEPS
jgi:hypothetical protein